MKTLIISDIHIGRKDSNVSKLADFIKNTPSDRIILNGDIFDQFALWKDKGRLYRNEHKIHVKNIYKILKERETEIIYLAGNHDYLTLLLIPFGFLFGITIRKRWSEPTFMVEHGDWISFYLTIRRLFLINRSIKLKSYVENCILFAKIKDKFLIVGHSHKPGNFHTVYDEGDWVEHNTCLILEDKQPKYES